VNINRVKVIAPLILVTVIVGIALVVAPRYLSSDSSAGNSSGTMSGNAAEAKKRSIYAPRTETRSTKLDDSEISGVSGVQIARADTLTSPNMANMPSVTDQHRPLNGTGSGEISSREAFLDADRAGLRVNNPQSRQVLGCVIEPDETAEIGSPVVGVVSSIVSERGDRVERDQELAHLRANVERASVEVAHARTQADAEVRAAQANADFLRHKLARAEELVALNFVSKEALEQARADSHMAVERLAQAREQQHVWQRELNLANAQLQMRTIRAPFDGIIVDRYVSVGERIEDEPLFRIIKTDPLRVEIVAPSTMFGTVNMGTVVTILPELPNAPALLAEVVLVDSVIDGASNTFRVRATLPNPGGAMPSGLRCRAELSNLPAPVAEPLPAAPRKTATSINDRMVLRVDTNFDPMQGRATAAARQDKLPVAQKQ
jgi:RND family efflux transporter MFP subunit